MQMKVSQFTDDKIINKPKNFRRHIQFFFSKKGILKLYPTQENFSAYKNYQFEIASQILDFKEDSDNSNRKMERKETFNYEEIQKLQYIKHYNIKLIVNT